MTTRTKTTAVALTGAITLASGAYALGTQSGGGDAAAKAGNSSTKTKVARAYGVRGIHRGPFGRGEGLDALATKLGVTPAKLQAAFQALAQEKKDEFAQKLADELGIDVSKVKAAFDELKPAGGPPPGPPPPGARTMGPGPGPRVDFLAQALADKLGLDVAKVKDALGNLSPNDIQAAGGPAEAIAKALNVDVSKVRDALQSLRPPGGPGGPHMERHRAFGPDLSALATKLGVSEDKLKAAFEKLRTQARDDFATALANKLGIDPQKVKDALPAGGGPKFFFHGRRRP